MLHHSTPQNSVTTTGMGVQVSSVAWGGFMAGPRSAVQGSRLWGSAGLPVEPHILGPAATGTCCHGAS